MIPGRVERYLVDRCPGGVTLRMRQGRNALGVAAFSVGVLFLSWWFGPYGSRALDFGFSFYWVWSGFWGLVVIAALIGALLREDWTITDRETVATTSFAGWRRSRRLPRTRSLGIRVEHRASSGDSGPIFPWRVHILDDQRNVSGLCVHLQRRRSVDRLLEALRAGLLLEVEGPT